MRDEKREYILGDSERENYGKWNSSLWGLTNVQFWILAASMILKLNIVHLLYGIRDNISQYEVAWWLCVFRWFVLDIAIPLHFFIISVQKVVLFKELDFKKSSSMGGTIIKQNEAFPIGKMACFLTLKWSSCRILHRRTLQGLG